MSDDPRDNTDPEIAIRISQWFDVLIKMRQAAGVVPSEQLIELIKDAPLDLLRSDYHWLLILLADRFDLRHDDIERRLQQRQRKSGKRAPWKDEIDAMHLSGWDPERVRVNIQDLVDSRTSCFSDIDGDTITYTQRNGVERDITLETIRKHYVESKTRR